MLGSLLLIHVSLVSSPISSFCQDWLYLSSHGDNSVTEIFPWVWGKVNSYGDMLFQDNQTSGIELWELI